jgi:transposase
MAKSHKKAKKSKAKKNEKLPVVHANAAGIDVGSQEHWVCVPENRDGEPIRKFGAFTCDLYAIADWLKECGIETIAMESTGVYWIPLYQILEQRGFEVFLVNAAHVKNVPGRSKTDRIDCQWIQKLHSFGLLSASFRPDEEICELRALLRHRDNLIQMSAMHVQHVHKSLHQMNVLLDKVVSDVTGVTGLRILDAILSGQRDPLILAQLRDPRIRASEDEIVKALEGDYRKEHLFTLKQALASYKYTRRQIIQCDKEVEKLLKRLKKKVNAQTDPPPSPMASHKKPKGNEPSFDLRTYLYELLGVDATRIPGFQASTVQTLVSEAGVDMNKWESEKHFASWLGLCPDPYVSGGKVIKRRTKKCQSRAALALRRAATTLLHSPTWLGAFYRRMRTRLGAQKAITATAHKLAVVYYWMVKRGTEYKELGQDYYAKHHRARTVNRIRQQARKLGYDLVPQQA